MDTAKRQWYERLILLIIATLSSKYRNETVTRKGKFIVQKSPFVIDEEAPTNDVYLVPKHIIETVAKINNKYDFDSDELYSILDSFSFDEIYGWGTLRDENGTLLGVLFSTDIINAAYNES